MIHVVSELSKGSLSTLDFILHKLESRFILLDFNVRFCDMPISEGNLWIEFGERMYIVSTSVNAICLSATCYDITRLLIMQSG